MSGHRDPVAPIPPDLELIRRSLAGMQLPEPPPEGKLAAVALVLAGEAADLHICLIRRAEQERDRWSGHIALPGGRVDARDASAQAAAIRETWEEVRIRLHPVQCLGSLRAQPVSSRGTATGMSLSSFVFHLGETLEQLTPTDDEVAEAFWVPLRHLLDPENAAHRLTPRDGVTLQFPAVLYQGHYIWGLTYRVLGTFFEQMELEIACPAPRASDERAGRSRPQASTQSTGEHLPQS
jgi:8-oxo-dGTP pyrophosphatase MutT (NUDIX family)